MDKTKRAKWTVDEIVLSVRYATAHHDKFVLKKKNRKTMDFWQEVGLSVNHSGEEVESLLKNLQQSFQQQRMKLHLSGGDTFIPMIRNSEELFKVFDEYYQLFYPRGGSALPAVVMTEQSVQFFSQLTQPMPSTTTSSTNLPFTSLPSSSVPSSSSNLSCTSPTSFSVPCTSSSPSNLPIASPPSSSVPYSSSSLSCNTSTSFSVPCTSSSPSNLPITSSTSSSSSSSFRSQVANRKAKPTKRKLSTDSFLRQTLALQNKALQLKRKKLSLETRKVQALENIVSHLSTFQAMYSVVQGISFESCNEL